MCINLVAHCDELALNLSSTSSTSPYTNVTSQTQPVSTDDSQLSSSSPSTNTVLTPDQLQLKLYEETKADLLTLARIQLDILGVASNMVPTPSMHVSRSVLRKSAAQAASALETAAVGSSEGGGEGGMENVFKEIPNESLRMALTDRDTFDSLYLVNNDGKVLLMPMISFYYSLWKRRLLLVHLDQQNILVDDG